MKRQTLLFNMLVAYGVFQSASLHAAFGSERIVGTSLNESIAGGGTPFSLEKGDESAGKGDLLYVKLAAREDINEVNTWTGASDSTWNYTEENWKNSSDKKFVEGDVAVFDGTDTQGDIAVNAGGIGASGIYVSGGMDYVLTGGGLETDKDLGTLAGTDAAGGKLVLGQIAENKDTLASKAYTGTFDISGIEGTNNFKDGIEIHSGSLRVGSVANIGTTLSKLSMIGVDSNLILGNVGEGVYNFDGLVSDIHRLFSQKAINLQIEDGVSVEFSNSSSALHGGAIAVGQNTSSHPELWNDKSATIQMGDDAKLSFKNNYSQSNGGAVSVQHDTFNKATLDISAGKNGEIVFEDNASDFSGGAISVKTLGGTNLNLSSADNGKILFSGNRSDRVGGAIYVVTDHVYPINSSIEVGNSGVIGFENNESSTGGAIYMSSLPTSVTSTIKAGDNGLIYFKNNIANTSAGGAIYLSMGGSGGGQYYLTKDITVGDNGNIIFEGNRARGNGGAISMNSIENGHFDVLLKAGQNGLVEFTNNYSGEKGGAIYMGSYFTNDIVLTLDGTDADVVFRGNRHGVSDITETNPADGVANAIYIDGYYGNNGTVNLTAGTGRTVAFYDPIDSANSGLATININGTSTAASTGGTVLFSGKDYQVGSADVKSGIAANTTVFGGIFALEDNAEFGYAGTDKNTSFTLEINTALYSRSSTENAGNVLNADTINLKAGSKVVAEDADLDLNGLVSLSDLSGTVVFDSAENHVISVDSFTGGLILEKQGGGSLDILEVSDMGGALLVKGGSVNVFNADSLADVQVMLLMGEGQFNANGHSQTFKSLYAYEDSVVNMGGADLTVSNGAVAASLEDVNKLTKTGNASDILTLEGNGAFDDVSEIDILAGTLELRNITGTDSDKTINVGDDSVLDLSLNAAATSNDWTNLNITGGGTVIGANDKVEIDASNMGLQIGDASTPDQNGVYVVVNAENSDDVVTLNSNNAYKGTTQVQNGILNVTADSQLGDTALARQVMLDGGNMQISASFDTLRSIELLQDAVINVVDGAASVWGTMKDAVSSGATLTKTGGGELGLHLIDVNKVVVEEGTLSLNDNTISSVSTLVGSETSALDINAGTMVIYELDTLGDVSIATGANLDIYTSASVQDINGDGVVSSSGEFTAAGDIEAAKIYNYSGGSFSAEDVTLSDSLTNYDTFSAANVTVANNINNTGEFTVTGDTRASTVINSGIVNAEKVYGDVQNAGEFKFSGIDGDVDNRGVLKLGSDTAFITGHLINRGTVQFVNLDRTLTIGSLGTTGGIFDGGESAFVMDVNSFTGESDRLLITGDASGSHNFVLNNVGEGVGDHLMQLDNLIVIQGDASSFTANSAGFDGGAFHYDLVQDSGSPGTFHGQVTGYSDVSQAAVNSIGAVSMGWFSQLDSLVKRMGELRIGAPRQNGELDFWVRAYGSQTDANLGVQGMSKFREYQWGTDFGGDVVFTSADGNHMTAFGAFVGYQGAKRRFNDRFGSKGETNSGYGGVYATWMHNEGWYSDLVIKGQGFDSSFDSYGTKESGDFKNFAFGASIEVGRQIVDSDGWFIEPSAQFAYMHIFAEDFTMGRTNIEVYNTDSDVYRMQGMVRVGRTLELYGMMFQPYVKAGLEVQFSSAGEVRMAGQTFRPNTDGARGVFGGGIGWQINNASQIYFDFESSIGDKYDRPWAVNLGYRVRF